MDTLVNVAMIQRNRIFTEQLYRMAVKSVKCAEIIQ
jgi:hypothetical protein